MSEIELQTRTNLEKHANVGSSDAQLQNSQDASVDEPDVTRSRVKLFVIMLALFLSLFIAALDQTITATAIPTICREFHSASGYTWIGGAYLLANAAAAPLWGKLSDIWGRKPMLLAAVAIFFCASIICATAVNMEMLIAGRALQGVGGGGLMQLVNIVISDLFSMRSRSLYLGLLECMWALAGGVGPLLGGAFTELVSWRWNFWVNLPICGTAFILLLIFLDVHNPRTRAMDGFKAIDWLGTLSVLALTLMLLLGLDFGGVTYPWKSPKVIVLIVIGCLMGVVFWLSEKRFAKYPLMPMVLFASQSNLASLLVTYVHGFVFIAAEYYMPLYFQSVKEAKPIQSGLYIIPLSVAEGLMGIVTGILIHRTGRYLELIWIGLVLLTIGNGLYILLDATSSVGQVIGFELIAGIGAGLVFEPPLIAMQAFVAQDDVATATSVVGFVRNLATSMSIVIGGVVFQNSMGLQTSRLRDSGLSQSLVMDFGGGDAAASVALIGTVEDMSQRLAIKEAFAYSLRNMWILMTSVSACGLVASVFIAKARLSKEHTETVTGIKEKEKPSASQA